MANKFTKSVLERQAKEMKAQSAAPAAELPIQEPPAVSTPEPVAEIAAPVAAPKSAKAKTAAATPDLNDFIVRDEGRTAKNKTFYLDASVINAIKRAAAAQKVTDSKLVNDILRKILGV